MHVFLEYLFDFDVLNADVRPGWCEIYDELYIDGTVIEGLENKLSRIGDLLSQIAEKATGKKSSLLETYGSTNQHSIADEKEKEKSQFTPTTFQPFNLTQVKPKAIPKPILIPRGVPVKPVPATTYSTNMTEVLDKKKSRKEKITEVNSRI